MVDIQMKILDIQTASPAKHSLFIKTEETLIKKVWPGTSMCTMSDSDINSSRFVLKLGNNSIGEVPLVEFTKEWIHSSKEIHGFRISLAYRVLLKRTEKQKDRQTDKCVITQLSSIFFCIYANHPRFLLDDSMALTKGKSERDRELSSSFFFTQFC